MPTSDSDISSDTRAIYARAVRHAVLPPILAMAVLAALLVGQVLALLSAARWEDRNDEVIAQANRTELLILDMETGARGYLVGADPKFLDPYRRSEKGVLPALKSLADLVSDDPSQEERVTGLRNAFLPLAGELRQEIALRHPGDGGVGGQSFAARFNQGRGKALMDGLRDRFDAFTATEKSLHQMRSETTQRVGVQTLAGGSIITLLLGLLLGSMTGRHMRDLSDRYETILNAEQLARDRLGATLTSIGDAVLVTDLAGHVTLMNPVCEQLTGWTASEAAGKDSRTVFDIVNEATRQGVESPVDRVIREGVVVGLANHTLLRRRDGTEIPIDDSGAPIRDGQGNLTGVVLVFRDVSERKQAEDVLSAAYRRETLIHRIDVAVLDTTDPEQVRHTAVAELGAALQTDRCFFALVDSTRDSVVIVEDWSLGKDLPSLAGSYRLSAFGVDVYELFRGGDPTVVDDIHLGPKSRRSWTEETISMLEQMQLAALIVVPYFDGGRLVGALGVGMSGTQRRWTDEEVDLVEAVAAQMRTAAEAARMQQRERAIATRLQETLNPAPPDAAPGLELSSYYGAALGEAEVGGDFIDVLDLGGRRTALVVADLSGKGLDAAAQVAIVRNMLRCILYQGKPLAEAVTELNAILAGNHLLTGFATLFVGVYDADPGTLLYVSCGQEPGLVCRIATSTVEQLPATGPVLGGFPTATFEQRAVSLEQGDTLALFTDGLTEIGPSRRNLLGVEGVAALLARAAAPGSEGGLPSASAVVSRLITEIDAFARGGVRDDVALLVGVVR